MDWTWLRPGIWAGFACVWQATDAVASTRREIVARLIFILSR